MKSFGAAATAMDIPVRDASATSAAVRPAQSSNQRRCTAAADTTVHIDLTVIVVVVRHRSTSHRLMKEAVVVMVMEMETALAHMRHMRL